MAGGMGGDAGGQQHVKKAMLEPRHVLGEDTLLSTVHSGGSLQIIRHT